MEKPERPFIPKVEPRFICLRTYYLNEQQVRQSLTKALNFFAKEFKDNTYLNCGMEINVICDSHGREIKNRKTSTNVMLSDPRVGHCLLGNNPDGKPRFETIKADESEDEMDFSKPLNFDDDVPRELSNWAESASVTKKQLGPIYILQAEYTREQIDALLDFQNFPLRNGEDIKDRRMTKFDIIVTPISVCNFANLEWSKDPNTGKKIFPKGYGCHQHILRCKTPLDDRFSKADLKKVFARYTSDTGEFKWEPPLEYRKAGITESKTESYPIIEFRTLTCVDPREVRVTGRPARLISCRTAVIIFSSSGQQAYDAQYAMAMCQQLILNGKHLVFDYMNKREFTESLSTIERIIPVSTPKPQKSNKPIGTEKTQKPNKHKK